jgi:hypothetical protein
MTLTDPHYAYVLLWELISGARVGTQQAQSNLDAYFGKAPRGQSNRRQPM